MSIVTERRAETFEEREVRRALFCLFYTRHFVSCLLLILAGLGWVGLGSSVLFSFVCVAHLAVRACGFLKASSVRLAHVLSRGCGR